MPSGGLGLQPAAAVQRLQSVWRARRRRRASSSQGRVTLLEIEREEWGLSNSIERSEHCYKCFRRRRCCLWTGCSLVALLLVYWTALIVDLASRAPHTCDGSPCVRAIFVPDVCNRSLAVEVALDFEWRAWSTVTVDEVEVEVVDAESSVALARASVPPATFSPGRVRVTLNTYAPHASTGTRPPRLRTLTHAPASTQGRLSRQRPSPVALAGRCTSLPPTKPRHPCTRSSRTATPPSMCPRVPLSARAL
jgi:hypothetical protein